MPCRTGWRARSSLFADAAITSWDGVSNIEQVEATDSEIGYQLTTHDFTIATTNGVYYRAAVRTAYAPSKGVKVISSPTITPLAPTAVSDWEPEEPTEGWRDTSASPAATDAIDSWATALTSSPQDLKLTTRDENAIARVRDADRGGRPPRSASPTPAHLRPARARPIPPLS